MAAGPRMSGCRQGYMGLGFRVWGLGLRDLGFSACYCQC